MWMFIHAEKIINADFSFNKWISHLTKKGYNFYESILKRLKIKKIGWSNISFIFKHANVKFIHWIKLLWNIKF